MVLRLTLVLVAALLFVACDDDDGDADPTAAAPTAEVLPTLEITVQVPPQGTAGPPPTENLTPVAIGDAEVPVANALQDLADRFEGVEIEDIDVTSVTPSSWPDTCLGVTSLSVEERECADVVTQGFVIILRQGGTGYQYHSDLTGENIRLAGLDLPEAD